MPLTPLGCHSERPLLGARNLLFLKLDQKQIPRCARNDNRLLRPPLLSLLLSLPLEEHQRVIVTIADPAERWLDHEYMEKIRREAAAMGPAPSLEEVRKALSKIPGNLSDDIRAEREGR